MHADIPLGLGPVSFLIESESLGGAANFIGFMLVSFSSFCANMLSTSKPHLLCNEMYFFAGMGLGLAIALGLSNIVETLLINQYFHILFRISLHLKVSPEHWPKLLTSLE